MSAAYDAGYEMGARHARTGDPLDQSDARCLPLETELDAAARAYDPRAPFGSADFHRGYERGYEDTMGGRS